MSMIGRTVATAGLVAALLGGGLTAAGTAQAASYPCSKDQTLRQGQNNSSCVKAMQTYLDGYINAKLSLDGDFGPKTDSAVRKFQSVMKIGVDGVVGPQTRTAVCSHTGIPVNSGATQAQIKAAADIVVPMCRGWGFSFN
jgi:peptidoglycan hydrolase-like protein with peptidoglycan-binding domain